ncbi:nitrite reductase [Westerdykella ornata]|uniref:Nitrite reductase [NAD(P)H] n=1 Tax=Westerdykella ornata TaxID=318751 RepID=A0A6A6JRB4_WESOR|nr:nitrite reductase [Westerdykella ornata]KAF2279181.1 nitrite reductase [Westerdykella ornata]
MSSDTHPIPILTPGIEPTSGESHSPPSFFPMETVWPSKQSDLAKPPPGEVQPNGISLDLKPVRPTNLPDGTRRKRIVVVGLGMVGIAFIRNRHCDTDAPSEKLMKLDATRREYHIVVIGEEPHLAYNRVGLTSFFQHRDVENLYLNPKEWYTSVPEGSLSYHINTLVTEIDTDAKNVKTSAGHVVAYDILVLATGSDAVLPKHTPGHDAKGVFVYRTIDDLQRLIDFSSTRKGTVGAVVGGGLLGLEAAHAMMDLDVFSQVKLIERNRWVLSRQLDGDAGAMVVEQVRALGLDVMLSKRVGKILTNEENYVKSVVFEDGEQMDCSCICFAIGIRARDDLARRSGIKCADRGGGIIVAPDLSTSVPDVYAIGECASWENQTFGLIAPGVEMADVLAFNLTQAKVHAPRKFKRPDLSTKLKLLGVEVASFGDFFADRDGPKELPGRQRAAKADNTAAGTRGKVKDLTDGPEPPPVKALTYRDPFQQVYKKYLFTPDGKYLLGGMMIGDTKDYVKLVPMVKNQKQLEIPPSELIIGAQKGDEDGDDLDDDTQICSCHNVTKGDVVNSVKSGTCKSIGDVKSCTKAGTGCGGCMPLVQTIFNKTMASMGQEVKNHLCPHFEYSRADLFNIIHVKGLKEFADVMKECGREPESAGCEACKPAIGSILSSLYNKHLLDQSRKGLQDTNDRFLANIQRNGTFSVIPRVSGGEITPEKLIIIGTVAKKYNLYCKITGGQRIDMFGARKQDLPAIWQELIDGGMESGHAYAKSLRTVKSCVGTTWCRFGIGDSVGMAVRLEERYKSLRAPHKIKGGVSGCVRECAEAQNKDFGLIATEKGFNIFVGGNGGAKPRHSELLAKDVPPDDVIPILDRYLAFYIRTADKLQRTARWIENMPGGIKYLQEVILQDKLGICAELEKQMEQLVGSFFCEWTEVLKSPERLAHFSQFANTDENINDTIEPVKERHQERPSYWPKDSVTEDFKGTKWTELAWQPIIKADQFKDIPTGDSKAVKRGDTQLAIFKVRGRWYCTQQMCPHKRAFVLSDGLIGDDLKNNKLWISCPLHKRNYELSGENAGRCNNDDNVNIATFPVEARDDGWVYVKLPSIEELDSVLGTEKFKIKKTETTDPFESLDKKLASMQLKGRKSIPVSHLEGGLGQERKAAMILAGGERGTGGLDW